MYITDQDQTTLGLLFNEAPLLIRKELAKRLGLNEAIVLQQLHFHIQNKYKSVKEKDRVDDRAWREGTFWTYNTYEEWQENDFPFWSTKTIKRTFKKLEDDGIVRAGNFNRMKTDRTKWYTINYENLLVEVTSENVDTEQKDNLSQSVVEQPDNVSLCAVEQPDNVSPTNGTICPEPTGQSVPMLPKKSLEVSLDSSSSHASRNLIDSELREKYSDRPFEQIKVALLADETAIIETDCQYEKLLNYRLKTYKAKKQFNIPKDPKQPKKSSGRKPIRTEILPDWFEEEQTKRTEVEEKPELSDAEIAAKQREIEEILKEFRK